MVRPVRLMETRLFNRDFSKINKLGRLIETGRSFVTLQKIEIILVVKVSLEKFKPGRLIEQDA